MFKFVALALLAVGLGGCAVASVAGAAADVATTAVSATADVASSAAHTVAGSSDDDKNKN